MFFVKDNVFAVVKSHLPILVSEVYVKRPVPVVQGVDAVAGLRHDFKFHPEAFHHLFGEDTSFRKGSESLEHPRVPAVRVAPVQAINTTPYVSGGIYGAYGYGYGNNGLVF